MSAHCSQTIECIGLNAKRLVRYNSLYNLLQQIDKMVCGCHAYHTGLFAIVAVAVRAERWRWGEQGNEIGIELNAFSRYVDNDFLALKIYRNPVERVKWTHTRHSDCFY